MEKIRNNTERNIPIPGEYGHPLPRELLMREMGYNGPFSRHSHGKKAVSHTLATSAVHTLCTKENIQKRKFKLPNGSRTTFHLCFSADATLVASCHGDHNVYISSVSSGEVLQTLSGHPRTPWCVTFHPTQNDILASGCLAGIVRVWDLKGGSESLITDSGTVIASLAFHPTVRMLAIATFNEIIFWDWGLKIPIARCSTENTKEKVRLVRFDRLGLSLITGITNFPSPPCQSASREGVQQPRERPFFRPNILSRSSPRSLIRQTESFINSSSTTTSSNSFPTFPHPHPQRFPYPQREEIIENEGAEEMELINHIVGEVEEEVTDPPLQDIDISLEVMADSPPSHPSQRQPPSSSSNPLPDLNERQDRFQSSYRQLVNHYQDLVSHYQQFLQSRIPGLIESSHSHNQSRTLRAEEPTIHMETVATSPTSSLSLIAHSPLSPPPTMSSIEIQTNSSIDLGELGDADDERSFQHLQHQHQDELETMILTDQVPGPSLVQLETRLTNEEHENEQDLMEESSSSLVLEQQQQLQQQNANSNSNSNGASNSSTEESSSRGSGSEEGNNNNTNRSSESSDLRSIEALAQNIIEMQNLCSQARRDAPVTIETQHIIELQNIRRHLEILQDQTRELQSSIRATLTSLARGSMDAMVRTHVNSNLTMTTANQSGSHSNSSGNTNNNPVLNLNSLPNSSSSSSSNLPNSDNISNSNSSSVQINNNNPILIRRSHTNLPTTTTSSNNNNSVPPSSIPQHQSSSSSNSGRVSLSGSSGNSTILRITIGPGQSGSQSGSSMNAGRGRVPPVVQMHYELAEPTAGTSRDYLLGRVGGSHEEGGPRSIMRQYQVFTGRAFMEHERNCPFSRENPSRRPPPRMATLTDLGQPIWLTVWPTNESGLEARTRSFRQLQTQGTGQGQETSSIVSSPSGSGSGSNNERNNSNIWPLLDGVGANGVHNNINNNHLPSGNGNQWVNCPFWVSNDVGVSVFLSLISGNSASRNENRSESNSSQRNQIIDYNRRGPGENWQSHFASGLAIIPNHVRQGNRVTAAKKKRTPGMCLHNSRAQRSPWDFREDFRSNLPTSSSSSSSASSSSSSNSNPLPSTSTSTSASTSSSNTLPLPPSTTNTTNNTNSSSNSRGVGVGSREVPGRLEGNFVRFFFLRIFEDFIPVFGPENLFDGFERGTEVRDGFQPHVYLFPIGLFLNGNNWELGTQTIGIYWPPTSREEEETLLSARRNDSIFIPLFNSSTLDSIQGSNSRLRIDYDTNRLQIHLSGGIYLNMVQSGLPILDAISTTLNMQRPRPPEGTFYMDYLSVFLEALERLFGHRRRSASATYYSHGGASVRLGRMYPNPMRSRNSEGGGDTNNNNEESPNNNNNNNNEGNENPQSSSGSRRGREDMRRFPRRIISFSNEASAAAASAGSNSNNNNNSNSRGVGGEGNQGENGIATGPSGPSPFVYRRRFAFPPTANASEEAQMEEIINPTFADNLVRSVNRLSQEFLNQVPEAEADNRRVREREYQIRLAVDTATAEVLRRQYHHPSSYSRAIESRIERVLNERGNRGNTSPPATSGGSGNISDGAIIDQHSHHSHTPLPPPSSSSSSSNAAQRPPSRDDIQMRISMIPYTVVSNTSRPSRYSSGSGNPHSQQSSSSSSSSATGSNSNGRLGGEENGNQVNNNSEGGSGRLGGNRRRPYPRSNSTNSGGPTPNNFEDSDETTPSRIPRMGDGSWQVSLNSRQRHTAGDSSSSGAVQFRYISDPRRSSSLGERWYIRRHRILPNGDLQQQSPQELYGSARTRASSNGSTAASGSINNDNHQSRGTGTGPNLFPSSHGGLPPPYPNLYTHRFSPYDEHIVEGGRGRYYPGYIPEILITPARSRATYYTQDASTTAFLSSRIQKWDFSKFVIPDLTKRDENVVVRECSLHSDSCIDISTDSDFIAVLQPSDNGSYSALGIYSLRNESLGQVLHVYHFDQNTVSVSISPSSDYVIVGYSGRGPLYRFVNSSKVIGQILSLTRDGENVKLVPVKEIFTETQGSISINCMHWIPIPGAGIIYGSNTGDLIQLY